jgi:outer membrane protein assembly factor BamB
MKPLRLWPGVVFAVLQGACWFVVPALLPDQAIYGFFGTLAASLAVLVWWAFFSRAPQLERWSFFLLMIAALFGTSRLLHVSVAQAGQGMMFIFYSIPSVLFAFVVAVVAGSWLGIQARRVVMIVTILLASGSWALIRMDGVRFGGGDYAWRWSPTPEERLLAQTKDEAQLLTPAPAEVAKQPSGMPISEKRAEPQPVPASAERTPEWPGFRGANRDSIIPGVRIATDWTKSPPAELWRRKVGPGWSSFAVNGNRLYTQEQRGEYEIVACYNLQTGEPVWTHRDMTRFWEANAGAGPRATPTLSSDRVYTFGATGILNALHAADGSVVWSHNVATDAEVKVPYWGFSSSPLVVGDVVIVAASGRLAAYDLASGELRWLGPKGGGSYSSPHLLTINGVPQVVLLTGAGATSVASADGTVLWKQEWPDAGGILQPALTADGDLLITISGMAGGDGMRRISVSNEAGGWSVKERWSSRGLKPYFNDFIVHKGHAYGFDGAILACIDLADGARKWKGGRYGQGQLVLLPAQDLLLVLSEDGELALVSATADKFTEVARTPAIEGKTWNHPVLVGDLLLVRNAEEMAAFRLSMAAR